MNREVSAKAFTTGQDIFFRVGEYSPGSNTGQKLIAHELAHVIQQSGDGIKPQVGTLLFKALTDQGSLLWMDVDLIEYPLDIIECLLATGKEIMQPSRAGGKGKRGGSMETRTMQESASLSTTGSATRHLHQDFP